MSNAFIKRLSSALVLTLAVVFASCDRAGDVSGPGESFGTPQFTSVGLVGVNGGSVSGIPLAKSLVVIGGRGGTLTVAGHTLIIPNNAAPNNTLITFSVSSTNRFQVGVLAASFMGAPVTFSQPLQLKLDYGTTPPSSLGIAQSTVNGLVSVPSLITGTNVVGQISGIATYLLSDYHLPE